MRTIILGNNGRYETQVSDEDYAYLVQWRWQYKLSSKRYQGSADKGVYAKRTTTVNGRKITLLMSHVILERMGKPRPGPDYDADHGDDHSLNNQRHNLGWVHKTPNRGKASNRSCYYAEAA